MDFPKLLNDIENSNQPPQSKDAFFRGTIKLWQSFEISQGRSGNVVYKGVTYTVDNQPAPIITPTLKTMELIPLRAISFKGEIQEYIEFKNLDPNGVYWFTALKEFVEKNYPTDADVPEQGYDKCSIKLTFGNCNPPNGWGDRVDIGKTGGDVNPRASENFIFEDILRGAVFNTLKCLEYQNGWRRKLLTQEEHDNPDDFISQKGHLFRMFANWIRVTQWDWALEGRQIKEMIVNLFRQQWERDDIDRVFPEIASEKPSNYEEFVDDILPMVVPNYFIEFLNGEQFQKVYVDCPDWVREDLINEIREFAGRKKQDWLGWLNGVKTTRGTQQAASSRATRPTTPTPPTRQPQTPAPASTPAPTSATPTSRGGQQGGQRGGQRGGGATPPTGQRGQRGGQRGGGSTPPVPPTTSTTPTPPRQPKPKKKKLELTDILTEEELRELGLI